jgi:hypothetical protein
MIRFIIDLLKLGFYGFVVIQSYHISYVLAIGFGGVFLLFELGLFLMSFLHKEIEALRLAHSQTVNTDFGFSSEELTNEEAELVDQIREGDAAAAVELLKGRCNNKVLDFNLLPEPVTLIMAKRLINAINRRESPSWKDLLSENKNEKEASI